jgi:epoxyqueuosine reductase QueG
MELNNEVQKIIITNGGSYFGVADLSSAKASIVEQGGPEAGKYPFSISIGITLFHPVVDLLPNRSQRSVALNYRHHCYDIVNQRLDLIASIVASYIQGNGYRAFPLPAAERIDDERICAQFSHKLGARLAGLGWIGKSCLLITPDNGPRVRWVTVLTDAPLKPTGEVMEDKCGNCNACINICPVNAFTGRVFKEGEPRELRYDAKKCEEYFKSMDKSGQIKVCGMCVYVCPFGLKKVDSK